VSSLKRRIFLHRSIRIKMLTSSNYQNVSKQTTRQILDGCLIANELIRMANLEGHKLLLFKVDFEKAFDSVNWNFLFDVMKQFGFGDKWIGWIRSCLSSASIFVLINGLPSKEFSMEKGFYSSSNSSMVSGVWCDIIKALASIDSIDLEFKYSFTLRFRMVLRCLSGRTFGVGMGSVLWTHSLVFLLLIPSKIAPLVIDGILLMAPGLDIGNGGTNLFAKLEDVASIKEEDIFSSIQRPTKTWIAARFSKGFAEWDRWFSRPFDVLNIG
nr:cysteine-rich receptor-like protein kinase [Tanacetum cinerariifolium]